MVRSDIRLALPSKGALQQGAIDLLASCGLKVLRPNPRQYAATIPALAGITVMFQRPGDIVVRVREGTMDLGITGLDVLAEKTDDGRSPHGDGRHALLTLHDALGFGASTLNLAIPMASHIYTMQDVAAWAQRLAADGRVLRVATKFPHVTGRFLRTHGVHPYKLITVEGTLEIAPTIGYVDVISDLVSSGTTLRDNHLRPLDDGLILRSQACLIANRRALKIRPEVLAVARQLIEYIEAHLRAEDSYLVIANMRGDSPQAIARKMFSQTSISGLQGPTIAPVLPPNGTEPASNWFAVNVVVSKETLFQAIAELRAIGGSGVIASPLTYIFEEEPARYKAMLAALEIPQQQDSA